MKIDNKKKYEYVIGIDLGHGETSAAICPLQWDKGPKEEDPVKDLEMGGNRKVIPSAITILEDCTAYIGDAAFNPEILKKASVRVCFKQAPKDINGEAEKVMIRFMHEVYVRIRENNQALLQEGNHLVYIATPSGWNKQHQALYMQMAEAAGLPIIGVTQESRAAFVHAQKNAISGLSKNIHKGAIVFDMGSSTLDFTYLSDACAKPIDYGYNCGASLVEKTIYGKKRDEVDAIRLFEEKYPKLVDYLLFQARAAKEKIYFEPSLPYKKTINFEDFVDDEELEDERFKFNFQPGQLDELLVQTGYVKKIEDAMIDFRQTKIHNQPIYGVFRTGGASRMDFIDELVCKCWGVTSEQIYHDTDPSLTISQGVAEVARMDLKTEGMDKSLDESIKELMGGSQIYDTFIDEFGYELWNKVTDKIADIINYFGEAEKDYSINDLQYGLAQGISETINEVSPQASDFIQQSIETNLKDIQEKVDNIIRHYSQQGINTKVSYSVTIPQISDINLEGVMDGISQRITEESSGWGEVIAAVGIGGAIGVLIAAGGPLAWILGGLGYLAYKFFGKEPTEEEKKAKAMEKELNLEERKKVHNELENKWDDILEQVRQSILSSLTSDNTIKQAIKKCVEQTLESYRENLKSARILID